MPKVSIILPTFNRAHLIGQSVQSVLQQTFQDFEIVIVDDGSTDETGQVIRSLSAPEKIKYIYQQNQGRSKARNAALQNATGQYIAFLDSDDLFLPDKLQTQVDYLDSYPDIGMVYTSAACEDELGNPLDDIYLALAEGFIYHEIAFYVPVTIILPAVMVRREVIDRVGYFDENLDRFEDTDYWRRISRVCKIGAIAQVLCRIKTHSGNMLAAQNPSKLVEDVKKYVDKVCRDDNSESFFFLRKGAFRLYYYYGRAASGMSDPKWSGASKELRKLAFQANRFEYVKIELLLALRSLLKGLLQRLLPGNLFCRLRNFYRLVTHVDNNG